MATDNTSPPKANGNGTNSPNDKILWAAITAIGVLAGGGGGMGVFSSITSQGERISRLESQVEQAQYQMERMEGKIDRLLNMEKKP